MLRVAGAGHYFHPGQWLFRDHTLDVARGQVAALLGPNGRGKTTLLKAMVGLVRLREGRVDADGRIGFVPQFFASTFPYTTAEIVVMGRARHVGLLASPSRRDRDIAAAALERVGLAALAGRPFNRLSGGERQLALIARALASECDILLLDEPASALDLRNQGLVLRLIRELADQRGLAVLFTTHHPEHVFAAADRVIMMIGPRDMIVGPTEAVMNDRNLARLYGIDVRRVDIDIAGRRHAAVVPIHPGADHAHA